MTSGANDESFHNTPAVSPRQPKGPGVADPTSTPTRPPAALGGAEMSDPQRRQAWIAGLQRDLNRFLSELGAPTRIAVDGEWDEFTDAAFRDVCRMLGIAPDRSVRTFRLIAGAAAAPTADELAKRSSDGAAFATALRAKFASQRGLGGVAL